MVIIISGTPAAGKSSVAKDLAAKFKKSAHLEIDLFKDMIVGGNVAPWDPKGPEQFEIIEKNFLGITRNFLDQGFVVIVDYVFNDDQVKKYRDMFGEVYGFLLLPSIDELKRRDSERSPEYSLGHRIDALYPNFANVEHDELVVIDSTSQTISDTVEDIYKRIQDK